MKLRTWNSPLVTFLSGGNTVILKSDTELEEFISQMKTLGIDVSSLRRANSSLGLLVEYDNGKGVTYWNDSRRHPTMGSAIQASKEWYEIDPYNWEDIKMD